ncbi:MAG: phosphate signaling complex protein PhoU [Ruminococcus sp.]
MRKQYNEQLAVLNTNLIRMCALCEDAISIAIHMMLDGDHSRISQVEGLEEQIDEMNRSIEMLCTRLLLMQQPVASDLRMVSSAINMISDLERIGDQALDISEIAAQNDFSVLSVQFHVKEMAIATIGMVTDSVDSFVKNNLALAKSIAAADDKVDQLFTQVKEELTAHLMKQQEDSEIVMNMLLIAKYLERIADHAVNVSEWVIYSITGEMK